MDCDATVNYEYDAELSIFEKMENGYKIHHNHKIICDYVENVIWLILIIKKRAHCALFYYDYLFRNEKPILW